MEAPFYVGQKVICIEAGETHCGSCQVFEKMVYTISCPTYYYRGFEVVELSELPNSRWWAERFAPIQDQYADITADIAAGVTETKEQPDKVIIPAKPESVPCEN